MRRRSRSIFAAFRGVDCQARRGSRELASLRLSTGVVSSEARARRRKMIIFITGVPGAGKNAGRAEHRNEEAR